MKADRVCAFSWLAGPTFSPAAGGSPGSANASMGRVSSGFGDPFLCSRPYPSRGVFPPAPPFVETATERAETKARVRDAVHVLLPRTTESGEGQT